MNSSLMFEQKAIGFDNNKATTTELSPNANSADRGAGLTVSPKTPKQKKKKKKKDSKRKSPKRVSSKTSSISSSTATNDDDAEVVTRPRPLATSRPVDWDKEQGMGKNTKDKKENGNVNENNYVEQNQRASELSSHSISPRRFGNIELSDDDELNTSSHVIVYPDDGISPAVRVKAPSKKKSRGGSLSPRPTEATTHQSLDTNNRSLSSLISQEEQGTNRGLFVQYILSQGLSREQADRMADKFFHTNTAEGEPPETKQVSSGNRLRAEQQVTAVASPMMPPTLSAAERKALDASGPTAGMTVVANSQGAQAMPLSQSSHRIPLAQSSPILTTTTNQQRRPRRPMSIVWPRADQPGAVEMEGRAFGAPVRVNHDASWEDAITTTNFNDEVFDDDNKSSSSPSTRLVVDTTAYAIHAKRVEAEPDLISIVYAQSKPLGFVDFVKTHPHRRCIIFGIIALVTGCLGAVVLAVSRVGGGSQSLSLTVPPTMAPSAMPSVISEEILAAAEALSGGEIKPGSPQFEAVGWMSTFDRMSVLGQGSSVFEQRYAFVLLYFMTDGEQWSDRADWLNADAHECDWSGDIECAMDPAGRRTVTELSLVSNNLQGSIPTEVKAFPELTIVDLSHNNLVGNLPAELLCLPNLRLLDLSRNALRGSLPQVFKLDKIVEMKLSQNQLEGTLPSSLYNLTNLRLLDLSFNHLSGPVSDDTRNLKSLESLYLQNNFFNGTLPAVGASYREGIYDWNAFTGTIPVPTLVSQRVFSASHNQLTGNIPTGEFESLGSDQDRFHELLSSLKIEKIDVGYNKLSGELPRIGLLTSLEYLDISGNGFYGRFPAGEYLPTNYQNISWLGIQHLAAAKNRFDGTLPLDFPNSLTLLDMSDNYFTGGIPRVKPVYESLEFLKISNNPLGGQMPDLTIPEAGRAVAIPTTYRPFLKMRKLQARNCSFVGNRLPRQIGLMSNLEILDLGMNHYQARIPPRTHTKLSLLSTMHLDNNELISTIPTTLGYLTRLTSLRLEGNNLSGRIPTELVSIVGLEYMNFQGNNLDGTIGEEFCSMSSLGDAGFPRSHVPCTVQCDCCTRTDETSGTDACKQPKDHEEDENNDQLILTDEGDVAKEQEEQGDPSRARAVRRRRRMLLRQ